MEVQVGPSSRAVVEVSKWAPPSFSVSSGSYPRVQVTLLLSQGLTRPTFPMDKDCHIAHITGERCPSVSKN